MENALRAPREVGGWRSLRGTSGAYPCQRGRRRGREGRGPAPRGGARTGARREHAEEVIMVPIGPLAGCGSVEPWERASRLGGGSLSWRSASLHAGPRRLDRIRAAGVTSPCPFPRRRPRGAKRSLADRHQPTLERARGRWSRAPPWSRLGGRSSEGHPRARGARYRASGRFAPVGPRSAALRSRRDAEGTPSASPSRRIAMLRRAPSRASRATIVHFR